MSFNIAVLEGRLTSDPELKTTQSNLVVTSFSIAVPRKTKNADGEYDTDFINIVAWRKTAEFITKYFKKGDKIGIEGSIQTQKYEDRNGNKRTAFEVVANAAHFIESRKETDKEDMLPEVGKKLQEAGFDISAPDDSGDLPF